MACNPTVDLLVRRLVGLFSHLFVRRLVLFYALGGELQPGRLPKRRNRLIVIAGTVLGRTERYVALGRGRICAYCGAIALKGYVHEGRRVIGAWRRLDRAD